MFDRTVGAHEHEMGWGSRQLQNRQSNPLLLVIFPRAVAVPPVCIIEGGRTESTRLHEEPLFPALGRQSFVGSPCTIDCDHTRRTIDSTALGQSISSLFFLHHPRASSLALVLTIDLPFRADLLHPPRRYIFCNAEPSYLTSRCPTHAASHSRHHPATGPAKTSITTALTFPSGRMTGGPRAPSPLRL